MKGHFCNIRTHTPQFLTFYFNVRVQRVEAENVKTNLMFIRNLSRKYTIFNHKENVPARIGY